MTRLLGVMILSFIGVFYPSCFLVAQSQTPLSAETTTLLRSYGETVGRSIKSHWSFSEPNKGRRAKVSINISPTGKLSNPKIALSSNNPFFDASVIQAVEKAETVPPPPPAIAKYFEKVTIVFDDGER